MSDVHRPAQPEPPDDVFKSPQADLEGLESFEEEVDSVPPPNPPPAPEPAPPLRSAPGPVSTPAPTTPRHGVPSRRSFSVFWPLVLICAGVVLFLSNMGYLPDISWNVLWRLWPLLLIGMGIDALIGKRSAFGAVIAALLILALLVGAVAFVLYAPRLPAFAGWTRSVNWTTEQIERPLGEARKAQVSIDWTSVPGRLRALDDSPNLIEGNLAVRGRLIFDVQERGQDVSVRLDQDSSDAWFGSWDLGPAEKRWDVRLSPRVPLELTLDGGSGSGDYDLAGLEIDDLALDVGSGSIDLALPATGSYEARIDGGSGSLRIVLPQNVGARVELKSGSGSFRPDDRFRLVRGERDDDGVWETQNYDRADHTVLLRIDQKSGSIRIQ